jgi:hypothetical protein
MVAKVQLAGRLWRHLGPRWLAFRAGYALQRRSGQLRRRTPACDWADISLEEVLANDAHVAADDYWLYRRHEAPAFFFDIDEREHYAPLLCSWDMGAVDSPQEMADELAVGNWLFFEHLNINVGCPPDWHTNALGGERAPSTLHWSQLSDFSYGDIKVIWEPSRFGFAFTLVRAYWRTGDERYAEIFWRLVEDWSLHNPPNQGPNWKCGQETAFRVLAWSFGLYGFLDAKASTPERVGMLAQMVAVSGQRIEANLAYAISQRNNHGISEGVGLWTIGLLFPEFQQANRWRDRGRGVLESLGRELIYDDGAFVQHSVNYHRLMLHDYLWALRLGEIHNKPLSLELSQRVASAGEFLYQIQDIKTGRVPYYGQNDGALILPLSSCDYQDFRPVVQATHYLGTGRRQCDSGPWDEDLLWLFGPESLSTGVDATPQVDLTPNPEAASHYVHSLDLPSYAVPVIVTVLAKLTCFTLTCGGRDRMWRQMQEPIATMLHSHGTIRWRLLPTTTR